MNTNSVQETIELIKGAMTRPQTDDLLKAAGITTANNLVWYDLEPTVKFYYPKLLPLRKKFPRVAGDGGTATHWKAVTGVNTAHVPVGVSEGKRNAYNTTTTKSYTATYVTLGHDDYISFEAQEASKNLSPDARAVAVGALLDSVMIDEEGQILGGNSSLAMGTASTPSLTDNSADGGAIPQTTTVKVYCVALTSEGFRSSAGIGLAAAGDTIQSYVSRTPQGETSAENVCGFAGKVSSVATVTTATDGDNAHTVSATVTAVAGAAAYAWFWGPTTGAGSLLGAITSINSIKISSEVGLGATAANDAGIAADYSTTTTYTFDGLISLINGAGQGDSDSASGAYTSRLATGTAGTGTVLAADGTGGVTQIDAALKDRYKNYKLSFDDIWVSYQQMLDLKQIVIGGGAAPIWRMNIDAGKGDAMADGRFAGGMVIGSYINPFGMSVSGEGSGKIIPIHVHPYLAPGTILFTADKLPYSLPNVTNLMQVKTRREYYQLDYPIVARKWEYGVYVSEVLQMMFGPAFGTIANIGSAN